MAEDRSITLLRATLSLLRQAAQHDFIHPFGIQVDYDQGAKDGETLMHDIENHLEQMAEVISKQNDFADEAVEIIRMVEEMAEAGTTRTDAIQTIERYLKAVFV